MKHKINYLYIISLCIIFNVLFSFTFNVLYGLLMFNDISQVGDPSLFQYLGYMLYKGKLPYVDFWDHKGFYLIIYESIAFFLPFDHNRATALNSVISIIIGCILSMKLAEKYHGRRISFITITLATLFAYIWNTTNTVEEIILPFIALIGIMTLNYIDNIKTKSLSYKEAFLVGIFIGTLFNIRVKESLIGIVPIVIVIYNELYKNKNWNLFIQYSLICLLGFMIPFIPILIYFGGNDALTDWYYANVTFGLIYANSGSLFTNSSFFDNIFNDTRGLILLPIFYIILYIAKGTKAKKIDSKNIFLIVYFLIIFIIIIIGMGYIHYLYIGIPLLFIFFEKVICDTKRYIKDYKKISITEKIIILTTFLYTLFFIIMGVTLNCSIKSSTVSQFYKNNSTASIKEDLNDIEHTTNKNITELYFHDCSPNIYIETNTIPNQKYIGYQTWWVKFDSKIEDEIDNELNKNEYIVWCKYYDPARMEYNKYINNNDVKVIEDNEKYTITKKQD